MSMREARAFSIELVDADGRKVRVAVTGHWGGLNAEVAARVVDRLGYELSDMESWTPEPPSGTVLFAAADSEFFEASKGLDSEPPFAMDAHGCRLEAAIEEQYDAWDEPRDVREGWEA